MISRLFLSLVFVGFIASVGGFVVLAAWDMPVTQKVVEKPLDISGLLEKKT